MKCLAFTRKGWVAWGFTPLQAESTETPRSLLLLTTGRIVRWLGDQQLRQNIRKYRINLENLGNSMKIFPIPETSNFQCRKRTRKKNVRIRDTSRAIIISFVNDDPFLRLTRAKSRFFVGQLLIANYPLMTSRTERPWAVRTCVILRTRRTGKMNFQLEIACSDSDDAHRLLPEREFLRRMMYVHPT